MAYLYRHIRLDKNTPFYIGIGSDSGRHEGKYRRAFKSSHRSRYWHNVATKTTYEVEIIFDNLSWEEACNKEREFIKLYGRANLNLGTLVNLTDGGDGIIGIKGKKNSLETRRKIGLANKGKVISKETRQKISTGLKGRKISEKSLKALIARNTGNKHSEETKKKISETKRLQFLQKQTRH